MNNKNNLYEQISRLFYLFLEHRDVARGGAEGAAAPPFSLIERFSKDDTTTLKRPKRGKNDVEMP